MSEEIIKCGFCKKELEFSSIFKYKKRKENTILLTKGTDRVRGLICPYCKCLLGFY